MAMRMKLPDPAKARRFFEAKLAFTTGPAEVKHVLDKGEAPNVIDVRASEDFADGHVPGAINLPESDWRNTRILSKRKLNVIYCYSQTCHLAARAAAGFAAKGFPVIEMDGGFEGWKEHGYEVERGARLISRAEEERAA